MKEITKLNEEETNLVVSILNSLIEMMPQDEYCFDDCCVGWTHDNGIETANGDDLTDTLKWVLNEVIPYTCKKNLLKKANKLSHYN